MQCPFEDSIRRAAHETIYTANFSISPGIDANQAHRQFVPSTVYIVLFIRLTQEGIFLASMCYIILIIIWVLPLMPLTELLDDAQSVEESTETRTLGLTDPYLFITYPHATIK
jgi:hypothetical protein